MVMLSTGLLAVGFSQPRSTWPRWTGIMTALELALRATMHLNWLRLPETRIGKRLRKGVHERWPAWRQKLLKWREAHVNHNQIREPFRPSLYLNPHHVFMW